MLSFDLNGKCLRTTVIDLYQNGSLDDLAFMPLIEVNGSPAKAVCIIVFPGGVRSGEANGCDLFSAPGLPLQMQKRGYPIPGEAQIRVKVSACRVCRFDLNVVDVELPSIIPGHEIVGRIDLIGRNVTTPGWRSASESLGSDIPAASAASAKRAWKIVRSSPLYRLYWDGGFTTHAVAGLREGAVGLIRLRLLISESGGLLLDARIVR